MSDQPPAGAVAKHGEVAARRSTDVVTQTGELATLEDVLEERWQRALLAWGTGDPAPLLELGAALGEARSLIYRIKERADERVRDTLARRGQKMMVSGEWQATESAGATTYVDPPGLRAALIAAGMDADAADQFFTLEVTNGTQLKALAARNDAVAEARAGHVKVGNPRVSYKRAGP